ncbi:MAG: phospho-sugar mutase [Pirellulaceae bacterium]|nr:phospho-sugar mutase [Pirellulaceae bacterium]
MNLDRFLGQVDSAVSARQLTDSAAANIRRWLTEPKYAAYAAQVAAHITAGKWQALDDAFWTVIPFGTGGRRGPMYPIGSNAINDRTIGESAQGLADYVRAIRGATPSPQPSAPSRRPSCAIAYDTRHNSRHFAELCAGILAANGFTVYFLDGFRSTPELSFLVRHQACDCGIMVTASHNPPSDNAVKVYWSTGGQIIPPHDRGIIERVMAVDQVQQLDFQVAVATGKVILCGDEIDRAFIAEVAGQACPGPRELKILYSPLHGVGEFAAVPALVADGFTDIEIFDLHREPSGDFPNVPGNVSNPENTAVFDAIIARGQEIGADLALATDPDCDRMGAAAPRTKDRAGPWTTFNGNQLAALLTDFVCEQRKKAGRLTNEHFLVSTFVTTPLIRRIGDSFGVRTMDRVHVGFKWIAEQIDRQGADKFLLGVEESHGLLIGQYVRDKDGAAACMLMAELAAAVKARKQTLVDRLESLYWQHGYHAERQVSIFMTGMAGMQRMQSLMQLLRSSPPASLGGLAVSGVRDYQELEPRGDMVILDLAAEGHFVAVRPSGTEPKVKFYLFGFVPAEQLHLLDIAQQETAERLDLIEADVRSLADSV